MHFGFRFRLFMGRHTSDWEQTQKFPSFFVRRFTGDQQVFSTRQFQSPKQPANEDERGKASAGEVKLGIDTPERGEESHASRVLTCLDLG